MQSLFFAINELFWELSFFCLHSSLSVHVSLSLSQSQSTHMHTRWALSSICVPPRRVSFNLARIQMKREASLGETWNGGINRNSQWHQRRRDKQTERANSLVLFVLIASWSLLLVKSQTLGSAEKNLHLGLKLSRKFSTVGDYLRKILLAGAKNKNSFIQRNSEFVKWAWKY